MGWDGMGWDTREDLKRRGFFFLSDAGWFYQIVLKVFWPAAKDWREVDYPAKAGLPVLLILLP